MPSASDKILVTGGAGFLGQVLCAKLRERGYTNLIIPRRREYDLTVEAEVIRLYKETRPTAVLHLAAEVGGIGANRASPGRFFFANLAMGLHLIEHGRLHGVEKFLQVGSICTYPKFTPVPFREEDLWNGYPEETNAPYGIAKKSLLVMIQAYRQQYNFNGIYVLPVNLYGPNDNFDLQNSHVVPALIRKYIEARDAGLHEVIAWGTGTPTREFLYVDDCAEGLLLAFEKAQTSDPINLGNGQEISIKELTETIARLTGFKGKVTWDPTKPDGQPRRSLDISRARDLLGFEPKIGLEEGLLRTIRWYESQPTQTKPAPR